MAMKPLKIAITGDAKNFSSAMTGVDSKLGKLTGSLGGIATAIGGAFAAGAIINFGQELFTLGSELEVMSNKAITVFGDELTVVEDWADNAAAKMGLTTNEAVGLATATGDLLKPMGFSSEAAAALSTDMVGLSGALAMNSQGSVDSAGASEILTKALLGERDGLQALGIKIDSAMVQERLLAEGKADLTGEALKQAEAEATLALITEQSADAITTYAEADGTLLVQKNLLTAKFKEVKEQLAEALIPLFSKLAGFMVDKGIPAFEKIAAKVGDFAAIVTPVVKEVVSRIQQFITKITDGKESTDDNVTAIRSLMEQMKSTFSSVMGFVGALVEGFKLIWAEFGDEISAVVRATILVALETLEVGFAAVELVLDSLTNVMGGDWSAVWRGAERVVDSFTSGIESAFNGMVNGVIDGINVIIRAWNGIEFSLPEVDIPGLGSFGGGTWGTNDIAVVRRLAEGTDNFSGGMVRVGERGPETVYLPQGSQVNPAHSSPASGQNITVNVTSPSDPHAIGREVAWANRTSGR